MGSFYRPWSDWPVTTWLEFFMCLFMHPVLLSYPQGIIQVDLHTTLTMLWWKFMVNNRADPWKTDIIHSRLLMHQINYKFMCLTTYWQWKLANKHARISVVVMKEILILDPNHLNAMHPKLGCTARLFNFVFVLFI